VLQNAGERQAIYERRDVVMQTTCDCFNAADFSLLGSGKEKSKEEEERGEEGVGADELLIRFVPNRGGWGGEKRTENKFAGGNHP